MEELEHLDGSRGGADVAGDQLVEPELLAEGREQGLLGLGDTGRELLGNLLAGLLEPHLLDRGRDALLRGLTLLVGERAELGLDPGLDLLEDAGHGEEPRRAHRGERLADLARVRADRDTDAADHRQVVVRPAFGDVGGGQPGDHLGSAIGEVHDLIDAAGQAHQVAVGELHALGRAGRAGGVDQGEHVVGLHLVDDRGRVVAGVHLLDLGERVGAAVAVHDDHVLDLGQVGAGLLEGLQEHGLDDRDLALGVRADVLDLLGRGGLVDREGDAAEGHGREVARDELGAVVEHQGDRVALRYAQLRQASGDLVDSLAQLVPADRIGVVLGADGRVVAEAVDRHVEGLDQVLRGQIPELPPARVALRSRDLHQLLLS